MYIHVNDLKVFYSIGNGSHKPGQPAVVFIHGAGMDHSVWVLCARYFARHNYNVVALDLPGHGRSEGKALATIEDMSNWVVSVMQTLGIDNASLVGHSMGSLVALTIAATVPARVRSLALLGTSTPMPVTDLLLDAARNNDHEAIDMANTWSHSNHGQLGGNDNPGINMIISGQRLLEAAHTDVFYSDLNACNNFVNGAALLSQIEADTLVLIGGADRMTAPVNARHVADTIPRARILEFEDCGHAILSEQPNQVLDALIGFV